MPTEYDLIGRPTNATDSVSLFREWLYNPRSELAAATIGTNCYGYAYDAIGNRLWAAANAATNSYSANSLNQYTSISNLCASVPLCEPSYDADGNLLADGAFSYAYDAENRLVSVTSAALTNGAIRVLNGYDHKHRRVRKTVQRLLSTVPPPPSPPVGEFEWQTTETHTFVYDGNLPVHETVQRSNGSTVERSYYWGMDKSGTEQGAGGVGGLLAVSIDGVFHFPCYDHNGNIVRYLDAQGDIVASYTYDAFGNAIAQTGALSDAFEFRFSTKYYETETGLYYYGYRYYKPEFMRWLNRDPIGEDGGMNLYCFVMNSPCIFQDALGTEIYTTIKFKRKHARYGSAIRSFIDSDYPDGDYYGHWWIEFDGESYGWWPSSQVGLRETVFGIKGEVNGIASFDGDSTHDPHDGDSADEEFNPKRKNRGKMKYGMAKYKKCKCTNEDDAKDCIRAFARQYSGKWLYPFNSCHTFQTQAMSNCCLTR